MTGPPNVSTEDRAPKTASRSDKAALLIVASTLKYGVGFVLPMVVVRLMSQAEYGTYRQLALITNFATALAVFGLPASVYYFYSRTHRPTLIAQTQLALLVSGAATALIVGFGAPQIAASMHNPQLRTLLPLYAVSIGFSIPGELFTPVMISQGRYTLAVGLDIVAMIFRICGVVAILLLGYGLQGVVTILVVFALFRLVSRNFWLWRGPDTLRQATWKSQFVRGQIAYGLPLMIGSSIVLFGAMIDKAIVALSFKPAEYAIYAVGALEIPLDSIFQASVANVLRAELPPLAAAGRFAEIVQIWRESVRKLGLIIMPSFVFLACFSHRFIVTLFTARYQASVPVFQIYLLALPLNCFVLSMVPQIFGKPRMNMYAAAIGTSGNAAMSLVLLRFVGLLGPAIAYIVSLYLMSLMYFIVNRNLLQTRARRLIPFADFARTALAAVLAALPAYAVISFAKGLRGLLAAGIVFSLGYALTGLLTRAFKPSDIATARVWLRRTALSR